jgi:hypothetical protein
MRLNPPRPAKAAMILALLLVTLLRSDLVFAAVCMKPAQCSAVAAACAALQDCSQREPKPGVQLSEQAACYVQRIPQQCNREDHCILGCVLNGGGQRVSGGCWHLCHHPMVTVDGETFGCSVEMPASSASACDLPALVVTPQAAAH